MTDSFKRTLIFTDYLAAACAGLQLEPEELSQRARELSERPEVRGAFAARPASTHRP